MCNEHHGNVLLEKDSKVFREMDVGDVTETHNVGQCGQVVTSRSNNSQPSCSTILVLSIVTSGRTPHVCERKALYKYSTRFSLKFEVLTGCKS
ncbi:hypothetical protein CDAR_579371 [Caerostris darwini]|uniref:Uncharacterized protein n=1 Tax=Caerostris darwini TaxID=1538125 RepID=A0AAV4V2M5_9ARAC|nr:hypothetical protein CDAR_579371 [Caerostris darwini]